ncbi:hypothetical protein BC937DRAFT_91506 [Endogone sp. FLAS-F59071]|nr:hypothetical protein BC937DRAFT_91506 [Endogone sp. FLAS-F59071]|eukprot:RUS21762.1 hypothetical protein BC937DRAFT_91506 [Endogone sp. FLAS-F59071]
MGKEWDSSGAGVGWLDDSNSTSQYPRQTQSASTLGTSTPNDVQTQLLHRHTTSDTRPMSLGPISSSPFDADMQNSSNISRVTSLRNSGQSSQENLTRNFASSTDSFSPYPNSISAAGVTRHTRRSASEGSAYTFHPHESGVDTGHDTNSFNRFYANDYVDDIVSHNNNVVNATNAVHRPTSPSTSVDRTQDYMARLLMGQSSAPWREEMHRTHSMNSVPQTPKGSVLPIHQTNKDNDESGV